MVNLKPTKDFFRIDEETHPLGRFVSPLIAYKKGRMLVRKDGTATKKEWWTAGSMIRISKYLGLTARHILDDHAAKVDGKPMPYNHYGIEGPLEEHLPFQSISGRTYELQTITTVNGKLARWDVQIQPFWNTDIALLYLTPMDIQAELDIFPEQPVLDLFPAPIDAEVVAVGFPNFKITSKRGKSVTTSHMQYLSKGTTYAISHNIETKEAWHPAFHFNARIEQGMSGGAVFKQVNSSWTFCGVLSKSLPAEGAGPQRSTASTLYPMLLQDSIDMRRAGIGLPFDGHCNIQQLAQRGLISAIGWDEFLILPEKPGWKRLLHLDPSRTATGRKDPRIVQEPPDFTTRDCQIADIPALQRIEQAVYPTGKRWSDTTFASYLEAADRKAIVAEASDGGVVGYIFFEIQPGEAYIANLAVKPMVGPGVGTRLLEIVQSQAPVIGLEVEINNVRAIRFYLRKGFTVINVKLATLMMTWLNSGRVINSQMFLGQPAEYSTLAIPPLN
jgi:N-acetylglutamate synthase-like GNAT family acetyltransferase